MLDGISGLATRVSDETRALARCVQAGVIRLEPPGRTIAVLRAASAYGTTGAGLPISALRCPDRAALVDELGSLTFAELDARSNALAHGLRALGVRERTGVGLLTRNHRGFFEAYFASQKVGARAVFLNTDHAGPQLRDVAEREGVELLVHDDEFASAVADARPALGKLRAWTEASSGAGGRTLEELIAGADSSPPPPPASHGTVVVLTSGTTGTPKGAQRESIRSLTSIAAILTVPFRSGQRFAVLPPTFHSLGLATSVLALVLGSTVHVRRRFDPDQTLDMIERERITTVITVPIMLQRLLDAQRERPRDLSSVEIVFCGGSQLGATLATRTLEEIGPVLYNMYGSTEVAYATIAGPEHLAKAPNTVGPPMLGARVRILDEHGHPLPTGQTGRIFVGNAVPFDGYTGGGGKEIIDGLLASGDVGHLDSDGLLFVDGRDDSMIVSGGENVFPDEVEELLCSHPDIDEAAVIGVPDEKFGARLRAFVVTPADAKLTADDVREHVRRHLARFKVPRDVVFLDELPRNPTGKLVKRELPTEALPQEDQRPSQS